MASLKEISRNVYERECGAENDYNDDIYKRHRDYFYDIGNVLLVEKKSYEALKKKIKKKEEYVFSEEGAKKLEELLYRYGQCMKGTDRSNSTKSLGKQIFKNDQYNAVFASDIISSYTDMVEANELVIMALECFYQLFSDSGMGEADVDKLLSDAERKFSYSKRKCIQKILKTFGWYIQELNKINEKRHLEEELTEKENAIWLNYANKEIHEKMEFVFKVREKMVEIGNSESLFSTHRNFHKQNIEDIEKIRKMEDNLLEICLSDQNVKALLKDYKTITGSSLDFEKLCSIVVWNDQSNDEKFNCLLMKELCGVPVDGNVKLSKEDTRSINKILTSLYKSVEEKKTGQWPEIFEENAPYRTKSEELLEKAIEEVENNLAIENLGNIINDLKLLNK